MSFLSTLRQDDQQAWSETMLNYAYDVSEWIDARNRLIELLEEQNLRAEEHALRSYLACCAEAVGSSTPLPSLLSTIEDFYTRYGMEEAREK
jgi:hypothetical protein